jgi:nicotinate phosphoribosyltransferase
MPDTPPSAPFSQGLFTDLYERTMGQAYHDEAMDRPAVFELYFRTMPRNRNYLVVAGLADVLDYLEHLRFSRADLEYLRRQNLFSEDFLRRLRDFRFTGDVYAIPEGTIVFPGEPVLQVVGPVAQAQLIETLAINQIHFQTLIATKAARVVHAARGRAAVDFGSRRAHGIDAAMKAARVTYLAGMQGTSNVLAGRQYGIPIYGTMAHSYIQSHETELQAFEAFARRFPQTTLLVDTYDTLHGVRKVIELAGRLGSDFNVRAIRLDSGDLAQLARDARRMLDEAGLRQVRIFASGGLDEYAIDRLTSGGAPIDGFGVGTSLVISSDAPAVETAYKLVAYDGHPKIKLSPGKVIYPGQKQVFRQTRADRPTGDLVTLHQEMAPGRPLLQLVMRSGRRLPSSTPTLEAIRAHAADERTRLPDALHALQSADEPYPVRFSDSLTRLRDEMASRR